MDVMESSVSSFLRFVIGFTVFIGLSFGITYAVNSYTLSQERSEQAAAAYQAMIGHNDAR